MAVVMIVVTSVIYRVLDKSSTSARQLTHSLQVFMRLNDAHNTIIATDIKSREYIATGNKAVAGAYNNLLTLPAINPDTLLAGMPEYTRQVQKLNTFIASRLRFNQSLMAAAGTGNLPYATAVLNSGQGNAIMDSINSVIKNIQATENNRINAISAWEAGTDKRIFTLLCSGVLTCLILLLIFYKMIIRNANLREKTEADLVEAKNIAENANKAKTSFLATMSQEIRTPVHDIISNTAMLEGTILTTGQQQYTGVIQRSSMALLAVVNDIIDFSNIETTRLPLDKIPFVLRDCMEEVIAAVGAHNNSNKLHYRIDGSLPALVECDAARLRQVLMTVTGTALKKNTSGHVDCNVRLVAETGNQLEIEFNIINVLTERDDTIANGTENARVKDSLFGMSSIRFSIAARLVSLMGGNIKVTTDTGKSISTTFTIKAGKVDANAAENFTARSKQVKWLDNDQAGKLSLRILVVDDHELNQALLVQILTKKGHTCSTARNGFEAAGIAMEEKFDIIFMDITMPVMNGIEATKRIREYYINTDAPLIIGVTANALFTEKQKGFDAGMNDFLIKPYKPADIQTMLDKWTALVFKLKYEL